MSASLRGSSACLRAPLLLYHSSIFDPCLYGEEVIVQCLAGSISLCFPDLEGPRDKKIGKGFVCRPKSEPVGPNEIPIQKWRHLRIAAPVSLQRAPADVLHHDAVHRDIFAMPLPGAIEPRAQAAARPVAELRHPFVCIGLEVISHAERAVRIIIAACSIAIH